MSMEATEILKKNDIQDVASYCGLVLLKEGMTVSPLKLQKILYYVQAWMMVFFDRQLLFDDKPQAVAFIKNIQEVHWLDRLMMNN